MQEQPQAFAFGQEHQNGVGVGGGATSSHNRFPAALTTMPGAQQPEELSRNSSGNSSGTLQVAADSTRHGETPPIRGSLHELILQAQNKDVVAAAARLVMQLPPNVMAAALSSLKCLPDEVATLAVAFCMCRRASGGETQATDPRLDPGVDAVEAQRIVEDRRLAAFSKFKSRVAALAEEAASLGLVARDPAPAAAAAVVEAASVSVAAIGASPAEPAPLARAPLQAAGNQQQQHMRLQQASQQSAGVSAAAAVHLAAAFPSKRHRGRGWRDVKASRASKSRPLAHALQTVASFKKVLPRLRPVCNPVEAEEQLVHWPPQPAALTSPLSPALSAGLHTSPLGAVLLCPVPSAAGGSAYPQQCVRAAPDTLVQSAAVTAVQQVLDSPQPQHLSSFTPAGMSGGGPHAPHQQWLHQAVSNDVYATAAAAAFAASSNQGGRAGGRSGNSSDSAASGLGSTTPPEGSRQLQSPAQHPAAGQVSSSMFAASAWQSTFGGAGTEVADAGQSMAGSWMGGPTAAGGSVAAASLMPRLPQFCGSLGMLDSFDPADSLLDLLGDDEYDLPLL